MLRRPESDRSNGEVVKVDVPAGELDCEYCCIKRWTPLNPAAAPGRLGPACCDETERCIDGDVDVPRSRASMRRAVDGDVVEVDEEEEEDPIAGAGADDDDATAPFGPDVLSLRCLSQKAKAGFFFAA